MNKTIRGKGLPQYAYLAGILDGEGGVSIYYHPKRNIYRLRVYVVNTDKELIETLKNTFGGLIYSRQKGSWKRKYDWLLTDKNIDSILKSILPFSIVKRERIKIAIEFRKTFQKHGHNLSPKAKEKRKKLWLELKKLNMRGLKTQDVRQEASRND